MGYFIRRLAILALPLMLAACVTNKYGAVPNEKFAVKAVDVSKISSKYWRQVVDYETDYKPGTIVVDTQEKFLYLVQDNGKAMRYGVGVGRAGLAFAGEAKIQLKREWPRWSPTQNMINREPEKYAKLAGGMEGGKNNPLGARALYLFRNGQDTMFRIHGSQEAWSIGKEISSGCIRLINQDVIDLYNRVPEGTRVVVLQNGDKNKSDKSLYRNSKS